MWYLVVCGLWFWSRFNSSRTVRFELKIAVHPTTDYCNKCSVDVPIDLETIFVGINSFLDDYVISYLSRFVYTCTTCSQDTKKCRAVFFFFPQSKSSASSASPNVCSAGHSYGNWHAVAKWWESVIISQWIVTILPDWMVISHRVSLMHLYFTVLFFWLDLI